jgi:hypothetical protein
MDSGWSHWKVEGSNVISEDGYDPKVLKFSTSRVGICIKMNVRRRYIVPDREVLIMVTILYSQTQQVNDSDALTTVQPDSTSLQSI